MSSIGNPEIARQEAGVESPKSLIGLSPKQAELLKWFQTNAGHLAEAYEGAIRLLSNKSFPGRVHFIAHAVRDIADRLVYVLDSHLKGRRVNYHNELDHIEKLWPNLQRFTDTNNGSAAQDKVPIDYRLASKIDSLVSAHRESRKQPSNGELLFRYLMRSQPSNAAVNRRLISDFEKMRDWFMAVTHFRSKASEVNEDELETQLSRFEGMLHSFVGNFFTGTRELDEILRQANQ